MKTLTEFNSISLKSAAEQMAALTAAGKTAEELPVALGEALKLEGDKLTRMIGALEIYRGRADGLKRILVLQPAKEGEPAPKGAQQKGEFFYLAEFFPSAPKPQSDRPERESRDGKRGKGGKKGGRGGKPDRDDRKPRRDDAGPRPEGIIIQAAPRGEAAPNVNGVSSKEGGDSRPPRGRGPRGPRRPREAGAAGAVGQNPAEPARPMKLPTARPKGEGAPQVSAPADAPNEPSQVSGSESPLGASPESHSESTSDHSAE